MSSGGFAQTYSRDQRLEAGKAREANRTAAAEPKPQPSKQGHANDK